MQIRTGYNQMLMILCWLSSKDYRKIITTVNCGVCWPWWRTRDLYQRSWKLYRFICCLAIAMPSVAIFDSLHKHSHYGGCWSTANARTFRLARWWVTDDFEKLQLSQPNPLSADQSVVVQITITGSQRGYADIWRRQGIPVSLSWTNYKGQYVANTPLLITRRLWRCVHILYWRRRCQEMQSILLDPAFTG